MRFKAATYQQFIVLDLIVKPITGIENTKGFLVTCIYIG